jgi:hypothetical protein
MSRLFLQRVNPLEHCNASLPQNLDLRVGRNSLWLLIQGHGIGCALTRFSCSHERPEVGVDLSDFLLQGLNLSRVPFCVSNPRIVACLLRKGRPRQKQRG